jgi:hypothetical protein
VANTRRWQAELSEMRDRAEALRRSVYPSPPLGLEDGRRALAAVRDEARVLFQETARAYESLCPAGYPQLEDNGITGPGGSIGLRFSAWHAFFFGLEHHKHTKPAAQRVPARVGDAPVRKRMPGEPLPPPDPTTRVELVTLALRWDESRGWVEVRRPLPARWDRAMLWEHLAAYLVGLNHDLAAGAVGMST